MPACCPAVVHFCDLTVEVPGGRFRFVIAGRPGPENHGEGNRRLAQGIKRPLVSACRTVREIGSPQVGCARATQEIELRVIAAIGLVLLLIAIVAFEATVGDFEDGIAAGLFAGAAIYDISFAFLAYLAPLWIALARAHPDTATIAVVNLLLGWTVVGWLFALAWAFARQRGKRELHHTSFRR